MTLKTKSLTFTGATQTFVVPQYITSLTIKVWGAAGGSQGGLGGPGGFSQGNLNVSPGDTLSVIVGQGGIPWGVSQPNTQLATFGGGGAGGPTTEQFKGSSGGGRSSVIVAGTEIITAGGGGGSSSSFSESGAIHAGSGGGTDGYAALPPAAFLCYGLMTGKGGTQTAGGAGGSGWLTFNDGADGTQFKGGTGGGGSNLGSSAGSAGGGGGGYFGGGGGAGEAQAGNGCPPSAGSQDVSGGGGSGFVGGVLAGLTLATTIAFATGSPINPPRNTDTNYVAGVGVAASGAVGGNGLVVFTFTQPDIIPTKSVDLTQTSTNSTLTYTIALNNTGTLSVDNIVFVDTIPTGTTFVPNSLTLNGNLVAGSPAPPGVTFTSLDPGISTVTFNVLVGNTIPSPNPITNTATSSYSGGGVFNSNTVSTTINAAIIGSTKRVDKTNSFIGSTLTYTVIYRNTGNTTADNIVLTDTAPNNTTFTPDSVTLNGVVQTGATVEPPTGFLVRSLGANKVATVTFQVTVDTIPVPNPVPNSAATNYEFVSNSILGTTVPASTNSNTVTTFINPDVNPLKVVDKQFATVGETLTYTITYRDEFAANQLNVIFFDTIPDGTTFITNSVLVNGTTVSGGVVAPPGLSLGTLPANGSLTISFKVIVNTIPSPNPMPNTGNITFDFVTDTVTNSKERRSSLSNTVNTKVNLAALTNMSKSVDKVFATVSDVLTYTIVFNTTGNITSDNIVLIDTIPNDTTFITDSITLNGTTVIGSTVAPPSGFTIGSVAPNTTTTVTFQVSVNTIPSPNPIPNVASVSGDFLVDEINLDTNPLGINSNITSTTINFSSITSTKAVNKTASGVGDVLTYTIALKNNGNTSSINVVFSDTIPNDTTFEANSLTQNGSAVTGSPEPPGVTLNNIAPGATLTVAFRVKVNTIPSPNPIPNSATTEFDYNIDITTTPNIVGSGSSNTNIVLTNVNNANLGNIIKSVDKPFATCGDIITYTITLPNSGNTNAINVVVTDTIPSGTTLVTDSVTVDGTVKTGVNPQSGIAIGTIPAGSQSVIKFQVRVVCS